MEEKIKRILACQAGIEPEDIDISHDLYNDLGFDELDGVEVLMEIEATFGIYIEDSDFAKVITVEELIKLANRAISKPEELKPKTKKTVKKRVIKFTEYTYDDGSVAVKPVTKGFNDFELVGLLSYYHDVFKVKMMQNNSKTK